MSKSKRGSAKKIIKVKKISLGKLISDDDLTVSPKKRPACSLSATPPAQVETTNNLGNHHDTKRIHFLRIYFLRRFLLDRHSSCVTSVSDTTADSAPSYLPVPSSTANTRRERNGSRFRLPPFQGKIIKAFWRYGECHDV